MPIYELNGQRPRLPDDGAFWVAPDAHVIGRVTLGTDVGIWFGAVLRADNDTIAVGDRSNIQDGAMLHVDEGFPLTIGVDVTIGHHAIVHGCTIGDNTLIGMGATILNGARIGRNCLVGAPAKAVRTLDAQAAERLRASALSYVANWQRFSKGLKPVG
jgi:carbonic anhydrase/acetyltransferase-like protein (isoleucine patch superfamily)